MLLFVQFRLRKYVPAAYWSVVVVRDVAEQPKYGGLGLGTTGTSYIFLGCILLLVIFLSITRRDATERRQPVPEAA